MQGRMLLIRNSGRLRVCVSSVSELSSLANIRLYLQLLWSLNYGIQNFGMAQTTLEPDRTLHRHNVEVWSVFPVEDDQ